MPTDPVHLPRHLDLGPEPDAAATSVLADHPAGAGAYRSRYEEDSFDYPTPPESWLADVSGEDLVDAVTSTDAGTRAAVEGPRSRAADTSLWQQLAGRQRTVAMVVAALLVVGVVFALSMVSDAVSPASQPVGGVSSDGASAAAPVDPSAPATSPVQPGASASASVSSPPGESGSTVSPSATAPPPGSGAGREDDGRGEDGREDHREDG